MIRFFRRQLRTLKFKLLWPTALMLVVIVVVLSIVVTTSYTRTILEQEYERIQTSFSFSEQTINQMLDSIESISINMLLEEAIVDYGNGDFKSDLEQVLARKAVLKKLETTVSTQSSLFGILFLGESGIVFGLLPSRTVFTNQNEKTIFSESMQEYLRADGGNVHWTGPFKGQDLYNIKVSAHVPEQIMVGSWVNRSLRLDASGQIRVLAIMDTAKLKDQLNLLRDGRSNLYLLNAAGEPIACANDSSPENLGVFPEIQEQQKTSGSLIVKNRSREQMFVCYRKMEAVGWYLVRELPMIEHNQTVNSLLLYTYATAALVFGLTLMIYFRWLRGFMKTFDSLRGAIERVRRGELDTRIETKFDIVEFEGIRREFNAMNSSLERLMVTSSMMERTQLELELRNLQTQLSPHMIFNSITAIRWMADMVGADRVADMLIELSEMLRPVFHEWRIEWTLGEELAHLDHYAKLLSLRYGNRLCMERDVPEALLPVRLPRFTLQPLVENACEHGGVTGDTLHVRISAYVEDSRITLTVQDDGKGIAPERLSEIRAQLSSPSPSERVGLSNVYRRLRLCMGTDSCLLIEQPPQGGTCVRISWGFDEKPDQITNSSYQS